uniref:Exonuclease domain-containing protein n=1 Tax=Corethron hystrix TaxID=216773 RepID=A0A7S1FLD2_9STRA
MHDAGMIDPSIQRHSLDRCYRKYLRREMPPETSERRRHEALYDAERTAEVFFAMRRDPAIWFRDKVPPDGTKERITEADRSPYKNRYCIASENKRKTEAEVRISRVRNPYKKSRPTGPGTNIHQ